MSCYFQGCTENATTKEHIPPRSLFPQGERLQLMTVKSCRLHNNGKSRNDLYVLPQICMNVSPSNRAREVFLERVKPQLSHNNGALRRMLRKGAIEVSEGVMYPVDLARFNEFFTALSCGLIYKSQKAALPSDYMFSHIYHRFISETDAKLRTLETGIDCFYDGKPLDFMEFGKPKALPDYA
jgi:hypothetical protein